MTAGAGTGAGAIGATGFGRDIDVVTDDGAAALLGAAFIGAGFLGAALFGAAFFGAAFFATAFFGAAFLAFRATFTFLAFFAGRAFRFMLPFLAAARLAFAGARFFPLAFFFAMVGHLLGFDPILVRVAPKKSAVICTRCWSRAGGLRRLPS